MDPLALARWQFAITTVYHFFFVPLTLGLSVMVAIMETIYVRTGNETYKRMTKFWGKLFMINFAMGVVTGIVQEFQFGMNWSEYSRFMGDIFGAPLAIEALLAFFLESTFLGVWIFGWNRLSKGMHAAAIWLVAIASNLSAVWILIANSFMQQPVGYALENGRAVMTDFYALVTNPNIFYQFPHTVLSGFTTAAFFVLGISAYHILRKNEADLFKRSFRMAAVVGVISVALLIFNGHSQGQHMVQIQPMKTAAAEALWETEDPASFSLLTITDLSLRKEVFSIRIPKLLSLLSFNKLEGEVRGLNDLQAEFEQKYGPGNYIPPVAIPYWAFRIMVGLGFLMAAAAVVAIFLTYRNAFEKRAGLLRFFPLLILAPYLANTAGWTLTEVGRYPWVVYGLITLEDSVSQVVTGGMLLVSLIGYILVYSLLIFATVYLIRKYALAGPEPAVIETDDPVEPKPSLMGAQG
ncbi:MAG: cytochrome ubiquinol oxidase subunit I [Anaerolineae bacterium]|nr:cytochrome ubiquinol oxidase subunit I [Anaerolineae bacterium]